MTTNNKLLSSLLLLAFASKCLISMPPKGEMQLAIGVVPTGPEDIDVFPVNLAAIGERSVISLPGVVEDT